MTGRTGIAVRHAAIAAILIGVTTWVWRLDVGGPALPSLSLDMPRAWISGDDAVTSAVAVVRVAALGFASYLLALVMIGGAVRWIGTPRGVRAIDRVTLPFLRVLLGGAASLSILSGPPVLAPTPTPMTTAPAPPSAVTTPPPEDDAQATLHLLLPDEPQPDVARSDVPAPVDEEWTIAPGQSFWEVADSHLRDTLGSALDDRAVEAYWRRLIDANRDRLADPSDPDLLFVDQVLVLPPVDAG